MMYPHVCIGFLQALWFPSFSQMHASRSPGYAKLTLGVKDYEKMCVYGLL